MRKRPACRLLVVAGLACALAACGGPRGLYWPIVPPDLPPPRIVGEAVDGTTVNVARTQRLVVALPADRDGVHRWGYELGGDRMIYPSGETPRFESAGGSGPAAATAIYTFRAEGTGSTSVRFIYRDRDSPQSPPARVIAFDVVTR